MNSSAATLGSIDEESDTDSPDEEQLDALLASAHTVDNAQWLEPKPSGTPADFTEAIEFQSCVDAYSAIVQAENVLGETHATNKSDTGNRKNRRAVGLPEFDVTKPIPNTIAEAAEQSDNWNADMGYKYAVERECGAWMKHEVLKSFKNGETLPPDLHALNLRTLFSIKKTKKGKFLRAKLRIVVLGHKHAARQGEHYFESFAQTVKWGNLRTACALACDEGFTIACQWDTNAAFLYGDNEPGSKIVIRVPADLQKTLGVSEYCWLAKAAYGLPSAPRGWYKHVVKFLTDSCGMRLLKQDEAILILRRGKSYLRICMYVDDFAIFSNDRALYEEVRDKYFAQFEGEEGPLDYMLGVNFDINFPEQSIRLYSTSSINKILERFGKPQRPSKVPMVEQDADLQYVDLPEIGSAEHHALRDRAARYQSLVPSMLYVATTSRPDICFAVGILCRCLANPSARHLEAADTLLAYLMDSKDLGVKYGHNSSKAGLSVIYSSLKEGLYAMSDSDWSSGKSISGYVLLLAGGPIVWGSKKQPVTAISSTEAEYYSASACGVETLATRHVVNEDLDTTIQATPVYIDNSACVNLAKDFNSCKRAKHINRRVNFLNDYVDQKEMEILSISTHDNTADIFTKPLGKIKFLKHRLSLVA